MHDGGSTLLPGSQVSNEKRDLEQYNNVRRFLPQPLRCRIRESRWVSQYSVLSSEKDVCIGGGWTDVYNSSDLFNFVLQCT